VSVGRSIFKVVRVVKLTVTFKCEQTIMPILMVAHNTINNLNFSDSDLSEKPLDFTMSKFKSSTPMKHPLYYQFFGSNNDTSSNHDEREEQQQGKVEKMSKYRLKIS
jgi:hypothetical protein